jgi:hypothetical protein
MLPLQAFAEKGYYAVWSTPTTKLVESGPYPSLAACQEFLAKMQGKFNNMQNAKCISK